MKHSEQRYTEKLAKLEKKGFRFCPIIPAEDSSKIVYPNGFIPTIERM